ncbi:hypothetical protein GUJ93_ZPchr0006g40831 [Zizania palustris]|uniref:Uncharacterized protein n=1 Tax=Zizania palustris TaxID=103762 RepID=A0A8J5SWW9_ZIZPA|nr:hypothetical protein GUJ93_ZPchr0006g40831 [Zizania palustris]
MYTVESLPLPPSLFIQLGGGLHDPRLRARRFRMEEPDLVQIPSGGLQKLCLAACSNPLADRGGRSKKKSRLKA